MQALLARGFCGRLATVGRDGAPYCTTMLYVWADGRIQMHGPRTTGHLRSNVDHEPRVCFAIDEPGPVFDYGRFECDSTTSYASVLVFGRVGVVEELAARQQFFDALMAKYRPTGAVRPKSFYPRIDQITLYALEVERMTGKEIVLPGIENQWPALDRSKSSARPAAVRSSVRSSQPRTCRKHRSIVTRHSAARSGSWRAMWLSGRARSTIWSARTCRRPGPASGSDLLVVTHAQLARADVSELSAIGAATISGPAVLKHRRGDAQQRPRLVTRMPGVGASSAACIPRRLAIRYHFSASSPAARRCLARICLPCSVPRARSLLRLQRDTSAKPRSSRAGRHHLHRQSLLPHTESGFT